MPGTSQRGGGILFSLLLEIGRSNLNISLKPMVFLSRLSLQLKKKVSKNTHLDAKLEEENSVRSPHAQATILKKIFFCSFSLHVSF